MGLMHENRFIPGGERGSYPRRMQLHEIYHTLTEKSQAIVDKYRLVRSNVVYHPDEKYEEGLTLLYNQVVSDLDELQTETFGEELLLAESIRFFMFLITIQHHPRQDWLSYYEWILRYYHTRGLLLWKQELTVMKNYKNKRVILTLKDENIRIPYHSTQAVVNDYGRYKADTILALRHEHGNLMRFEQVLAIIL